MFSKMSPRERILNSLQGKSTGRVAWCPNLAYYWEACYRHKVSIVALYVLLKLQLPHTMYVNPKT